MACQGPRLSFSCFLLSMKGVSMHRIQQVFFSTETHFLGVLREMFDNFVGKDVAVYLP